MFIPCYQIILKEENQDQNPCQPEGDEVASEQLVGWDYGRVLVDFQYF